MLVSTYRRDLGQGIARSLGQGDTAMASGSRVKPHRRQWMRKQRPSRRLVMLTNTGLGVCVCKGEDKKAWASPDWGAHTSGPRVPVLP